MSYPIVSAAFSSLAPTTYCSTTWDISKVEITFDIPDFPSGLNLQRQLQRVVSLLSIARRLHCNHYCQHRPPSCLPQLAEKPSSTNDALHILLPNRPPPLYINQPSLISLPTPKIKPHPQLHQPFSNKAPAMNVRHHYRPLSQYSATNHPPPLSLRQQHSSFASLTTDSQEG